jgi:hypothetical protein
LRRDIAWKVACGLRLDDEGFHPTVLVYWRNRLRASERPRRVFDAVREVVEQTGVLRGRGRRVLDSTILEDAVATQDTVTQLVGAIRRVRRLVPTARQVKLAAHDYERPGKPECAWDDAQAKQALVSGLVNDALAVLAAVADVELDAEQAEAVALLALVAGQDVEPGQRPGTWRIARRVAKDRVISTVDPEARHTRKTSAHKCDGYKGHIAAEPESGLVTECALTAATAPDGPTGVELLAAEQPGLEVLGDTHYGSGQTRAALTAAGHTQTIKPIPLSSAVPGGFTIHDFQIDAHACIVSCPAGYLANITASGRASFALWCQRCPLRGRCTTAKHGRTIRIHPHQDELRAARRRATTRSFQESYRRWRLMVERSIAWLHADPPGRLRSARLLVAGELLGWGVFGGFARRGVDLVGEGRGQPPVALVDPDLDRGMLAEQVGDALGLGGGLVVQATGTHRAAPQDSAVPVAAGGGLDGVLLALARH